MAERSKRIVLDNGEKLSQVNADTLKLLQKYRIDMSLRNLSPNTIYNYEKDLAQWFIYILDNQANQCVTDLTDDDISEFLYFCKQEGNHPERMRRRMSVISAFYKFLRKKRIIKENPTEFMDRPKGSVPIVVQTFLTPEQVALMRQKLTEYGDLQIQTYALLSLSTMARVNAIANLKWSMIDFDERVIHDVVEKEGKIVDLFFSEEVKDLLLKLKEQREQSNINDFGWIWYSNRVTESLSVGAGKLTDWCKVIGRLIDVPTLHPHDFRHSGATLLKNAGMALEDISLLLNHSSTDVTQQFYIKTDTKRLSKLKDEFQI